MPTQQSIASTQRISRLTDAELRRSVHIAGLLVVTLPPFVGGTSMALTGFYPVPEFFQIFLELNVILYVGVAVALSQYWATWLSRFLQGLPALGPSVAASVARRRLGLLPWILAGIVTLYSMGGVFLADLALEARGVASYNEIDHLRNLMGLIPVVLITVFPIYFYLLDRIGRYLGPRGVAVVAGPLWIKVGMLGIVTPLLIDSVLVSYYANRTGVFDSTTVLLWASLLAMAIGGTLLAWRSLRQGLTPLEAFVSSSYPASGSARDVLAPLSLDELGVLTARYAEMLARQKHAESLADIMIDQTGALIVLLDHEGRIARFNRAAEALSGYRFAEIAGKYPWETFLPPEDADTTRKNAFEALARNPGALAGQYTNYWVNRRGERFLTEWTNTVVLDAGGKMQYMIAIGHNVTEQRKAEDQLRRNEAWLRHTQAIANVGSWELDLSADILRWSEETSRIFGRELHLYGNNYAMFMDAVHPADRDRVDRAYQDSVSNHTPYDVAHRIVRPDGSVRWVQERAETFYDAEGRPLRSVGAVQDITERMSNEEKLRASNQIVSAVLDTTPVLIAYLDTDMNFVRVNAAYAAADGKDPDFFIGKSHFALFPNPENEAIFRRVAASGEPYVTVAKPFEYEHNPERGITHWDWTLTPIKNSQGNVEGLVLSLLNVTDRIHALEAIQESEQKLQRFNEELEARVQERTTALHEAMELNHQILGASDVGVAAYRSDGQCIFVNSAMSRITGGTGEALLGMNFHKIQFWKTAGIDVLALKALETGMPQGAEFNTRTTFGRDLWAYIHFTPFERTTGRHLLLMVTDITERKQADLALARNAQRLEAAQRIARIGDYALNFATGELFWSDTAYELLGYQPGDVTPSAEVLFERMHPEDVEKLRTVLHDAMTKTTATGPYPVAALPSLDYRVVLPDGTQRWIHTQAHIRFDEQRTPQLLAGTIQDITERKQAEAALIEARDHAERANKAKSEFLSRMSHELRTPMNAILGFAQVMELEQITPEQRDFVHEIHRAGDHLLELINELLDLSRIEVGKLAAVVQATNLSSSIVQAIHLLQPAMSARQVAVLNECPDTRFILADPTRLKQILVNLLSNATKYNREGGRITIRCVPAAEGRLRLSITDTGDGIPPEKLKNLFKPFERLGAEFSTVEGTGIGLALSQQLAELMGGHLGVESIPGQGSTFWLDLPQATIERSTTAVDGAKPGVSTIPDVRKKVLYVEDNPANLRVVEALFRHQPQLQLLSATNGEYGIELAGRYHPDVILLDIHLPGMDGYAVLDELKKNPKTREIPVIALSADAMPIDIERGLKAGFVHYLTKPVKGDELVAAVGAALTGVAQ